MHLRLIALALLVGILESSAIASVPLYDATSLAKPDQAPFAWGLQGGGATVTGPAAGSVYSVLDSSATVLAQEGWLRLSPVALNNVAGYDVTFDLGIEQESHNSANRAGLSVIILDSDHRGVELSFWANQIWNQNDSPLFTHGEGAAYDTTAAGTGVGGLRHYQVHVSNNAYTFSAEGSTLFGGAIRDYSAFAGSPNPYSTPNFLWVGDDTTEASAKSRFSYFNLTAAVPEPATLTVAFVGLAAFRRRRNLRKH